jgi:hypothetical protein
MAEVSETTGLRQYEQDNKNSISVAMWGFSETAGLHMAKHRGNEFGTQHLA